MLTTPPPRCKVCPLLHISTQEMLWFPVYAMQQIIYFLAVLWMEWCVYFLLVWPTEGITSAFRSWCPRIKSCYCMYSSRFHISYFFPFILLHLSFAVQSVMHCINTCYALTRFIVLCQFGNVLKWLNADCDRLLEHW